MTKKQSEIYEYIIGYMEKNLFSPTVREICEGVGLSSTSSVHSHLKKLEKQGYITTREAEPRTIRPIGYMMVKEEECAGAIDETDETMRED